MAWDDNVLSTLTSIARHEAEINELAGTYSRKALYQTADTKLYPSPDTIAAVRAVYSDLTTAALVYTTNVGGNYFTLPKEKYCIKLLIDDDYFSVLEGTGNILYSGSGDYTLTGGTSLVWVNIDTQYSWETKIEVAKDIIYNNLLAVLNQRNWDYDLDDIENPSVLGIASDYKTLELIYLDLLGKNGSDRFEKKMLDYRARYNAEIRSAMSMLDFGNTTLPYQFTQGIITR